MSKALATIPIERIEQTILLIRGERVILDSDLAKLYGVTTARLNQQVRRNVERFPDDFMFELTKEEYDSLMLQFATSKGGRGGRRKLPLVFTEHGAIMAANVLEQRTRCPGKRRRRSSLCSLATDDRFERRARAEAGGVGAEI